MPLQRTTASEQIANALRAEIEDGTLKPGQALPSDAQLASRFGVSTPTATKARAMLVALGLVASRTGAPSIVRDTGRIPISPSGHLRRARQTGPIYPEGNYARIERAGLTPASPDVTAALTLDPGAEVIERQRITYTSSDVPLAVSTSYFAAELAERCPALLSTERITQGTTLYVEQQTGRAASKIEASIACVSATSRPDLDATQLALPPDSCVLALSSTTYDSSGVAFAHEVELHPPDTPVILDVIHL